MYTLWFNNTTMFGMGEGESELRNLQWGDITLRNDYLVGEYLGLNMERQTKTRTTTDFQNIRKTRPTHHAILEDIDGCPVHLYKFCHSKRTSTMLHTSVPYYLATVTK